jgi:hypothetical protein
VKVSSQRVTGRGQAGCNALSKAVVSATVLLGMLTTSAPAHAVDGCVVLLCLAAPSWRAIPQCVPPIRALFRDLARGKGFPTCAMAGPGNSSSHEWASARGNCPPQYARQFEGPDGPIYSCDYTGAVAIQVDGVAWARTWWNLDGDSVTEFTLAAKKGMSAWDSKFDDDYAAWLAAQPPSPPPCLSC